MHRDVDNLTPLDARNSLLLERDYPGHKKNMFSVTSIGHDKEVPRRSPSPDRYAAAEEGSLGHSRSGSDGQTYRALTPVGPNEGTASLVQSAAPPAMARQPTLPALQGGYSRPGAYPSNAYGAAYRPYPSNGYAY